MERRELLKLIATATGTALFAGNVLAYTDVPAVPLSDTLFNEKDVALLNEMGEVIIPQTDTPGARRYVLHPRAGRRGSKTQTRFHRTTALRRPALVRSDRV